MTKVVLENPHLLGLAMESVDAIFKNATTMILNMRAMDFIDRGIEIDCAQTSIAARAACKELRNHKGLRMVDNNKDLLRYRWFDHVRFFNLYELEPF